jgi:hypothetical protein
MKLLIQVGQLLVTVVLLGVTLTLFRIVVDSRVNVVRRMPDNWFKRVLLFGEVTKYTIPKHVTSVVVYQLQEELRKLEKRARITKQVKTAFNPTLTSHSFAR